MIINTGQGPEQRQGEHEDVVPVPYSDEMGDPFLRRCTARAPDAPQQNRNIASFRSPPWPHSDHGHQRRDQ
jgi:hypothetical protein